MDAALTVSRSIALLLAGLYACGVLFVVLAPSGGRLPGPTYVRHWQALNPASRSPSASGTDAAMNRSSNHFELRFPLRLLQEQT